MTQASASNQIAALPIFLLVLAALCTGTAVWLLFFDATNRLLGGALLVVSAALFALALHFLFRHTRRTQKEDLNGK